MSKILNMFKNKKRRYPILLPGTVLTDELEKKVYTKFYF